ncbi:MAG: vitamin B12-dependent ribonucleotide reductase [Candidatus Nanoarchaeia archaeon]
MAFSLETYENLLGLSQASLTVLEKRYLSRDDNGQIIETPEELFWRVAWNLACAEVFYKFDIDPNIEKEELYKLIEQDPKKKALVKEWADKFYKLMISLEFLPNSPTLMNAGRRLQQLSACFVLPVADTIGNEQPGDGIFDAVKHAAMIHKSGGGTGFSFSRCRHRGATVKSTGREASGPVSWLKVLNESTESIKQGGSRRGANMGILRIDHPDIDEFIRCKNVEGQLANFNISVAITNKFMEAFEKDEEYELIAPHTGEVVDKRRARAMFRLIAENAWHNGEPGIIFIDRMNCPETNPTPSIGTIEATNPCGEQPLLPYESCNLGSINLGKFVENGAIAWDKLKETVFLAVRLLDNVVDMNNYPLSVIAKMTKGNRKIGLGIMGWADMLILLGIPYNSEKAFKLAERVMEFINYNAHLASVELAKERGPFPNFEISVFKDPEILKTIYKRSDSQLDWNFLHEQIAKYGQRNAACTTIAPTGTIAVIANASQGIEPLFAIAYERHTPTFDLIESNPYFERIAKERGFYSEELMKEVAKHFSIKNIKEIPEDVRKIFVTAHDLSPEDHIRMQAAFQKYTDNAVSKTINFPNSATKEDILKSYWLAWELGCKGLTVYRDGSRLVQVITVKKDSPQTTTTGQSQPITATPKARPEIMSGKTYKVKTGYGNLYVTINNDEAGKPFEVFATIGKSGGVLAAKCEAICRLISLALRAGIDPEEIIEQIKGIRGPMPTVSKIGVIHSIPDAISKVLSMHIDKGQTQITTFTADDKGQQTLEPKSAASVKNGKRQTNSSIADTGVLPECPECQGILEMSEGCMVCHSCGFSQCG